MPTAKHNTHRHSIAPALGLRAGVDAYHLLRCAPCAARITDAT
jgi:hypothetical protein